MSGLTPCQQPRTSSRQEYVNASSNHKLFIKACTAQLLAQHLKPLPTSLKSAHAFYISRCLIVRGRLHGMHSGGGSPFSKLLVSNGVFTPEQDNDKTTTRQMLNLCIPMTPFTPGPTNWCERHHVVVLSLSCRCLALV